MKLAYRLSEPLDANKLINDLNKLLVKEADLKNKYLTIDILEAKDSDQNLLLRLEHKEL